jgi:phosphoglycolate phosphatase
MPKQFRLLIFDWDGTLMDSASAIVSSLQAACADLGLRVPPEQEARYIIGLGLNDAMAHLLPGVTPTVYPQVAERYRHYFLARDAATRLFPGTEEAVRKLHASGHLLAVATGKSRRGLDRALSATGLAEFFHCTRCADEGCAKPDPQMLEHVMTRLGVERRQTLMIGDTTHDLSMANAAGVAALAVSYGAHSKDELLACNPIACIEQCEQLWRWLGEHA